MFTAAATATLAGPQRKIKKKTYRKSDFLFLFLNLFISPSLLLTHKHFFFFFLWFRKRKEEINQHGGVRERETREREIKVVGIIVITSRNIVNVFYPGKSGERPPYIFFGLGLI